MTLSSNVQVIESKDGSHTLYNPSLNETYHSIHGAKTESMHVFIRNGLQLITKQFPVILEVGMGTGLNVLLTRQYQLTTGRLKAIHYHTLELYPLSDATMQELNYTQHLSPSGIDFFHAIHRATWDNTTEIRKDFSLHKIQEDLVSFKPSFNYDVVYFDAFAPNVQPALWEKKIFERLYEHLNFGGVLTTYSAKGQLRRNLMAVGFRVERRPGPPGKREMLVAFKDVKE